MTDSYIGVPPKSGFINTAKQRVTSSTNNYVDLDHAISDLSDVIVWVNSVKQDSTNLSLTNPSKITLGGTLTASDIVEIVYLGKQVATQSPDTGSVTNSMLAGSIAQDKLSNEVINEAKLQVSNAPTNGYMLTAQSGNTGGLTWAEAPSGGLVYVGGGSTTSDVTNITIDNVFTSTYKNYLIVGEYTPDNSSGASARFKFRTGGSSGSDLSGAEYNYHFIRMNADSDSLNNHRSQANNYCDFTAPVKDDVLRVGVRLSWTVFDPYTSNRRTTVSGTGKFTATDANSGFISGECDYKGSESVTGIKFYFSADNVANADINVYGIVDS